MAKGVGHYFKDGSKHTGGKCLMVMCILEQRIQKIVKSFIIIQSCLQRPLKKEQGKRRDVSRETKWLENAKNPFVAPLRVKVQIIVPPRRVLG